MNDEKRNHDFDRAFTRPAAWRKVKEALDGQNHVDLLFRRLERIARNGSVRLYHAFALHAFGGGQRRGDVE